MPTSSLAKTTIRRDTKSGSSPASSIRIIRSIAASGSLPRIDLMKALNVVCSSPPCRRGAAVTLGGGPASIGAFCCRRRDSPSRAERRRRRRASPAAALAIAVSASSSADSPFAEAALLVAERAVQENDEVGIKILPENWVAINAPYLRRIESLVAVEFLLTKPIRSLISNAIQFVESICSQSVYVTIIVIPV